VKDLGLTLLAIERHGGPFEPPTSGIYGPKF
jgi:hypothetical protein